MSGGDDDCTMRVRQGGLLETRHGSEEQQPAQLVILVGSEAGRRFSLGNSLVVGRDPDSDVVLRDDGASRRHAKIIRNGRGGFAIYDLGSRNGTFVNGIRVEHADLNSGDKVAMGAETIFLFTHHDRYEEQVAQAQKLQALGQLASGIAHDFNNLMATILGNVTYLGVTPSNLEPDAAECLAEIETAARRAADLTGQLLSFARSRPRAHDALELRALVDEAMGLLRRTLPRNVQLVCEELDELTVVGDGSMLLQVLMNACINAGQAMPSGGIVRLSAMRVELPGGDPAAPETLPPGNYARLSIEDNGLGMTPETLERAFQPFFTTKPRGEGTGLGLATVAAVVRDHGGEVVLQSDPGQGTLLSAYLPASHKIVHQPLAERQNLYGLQGCVLLVDDEPMVLKATRRLLERFGLSVEVAADGLEALALFDDIGPRIQVAIVDLDMPTLDGEQTVDKLRERSPALPIVICSGHADPTRKRRIASRGVVGFLHKPFDMQALWTMAARALGQAPAHRP